MRTIEDTRSKLRTVASLKSVRLHLKGDGVVKNEKERRTKKTHERRKREEQRRYSKEERTDNKE